VQQASATISGDSNILLRDGALFGTSLEPEALLRTLWAIGSGWRYSPS
jgi:hypothetical protein